MVKKTVVLRTENKSATASRRKPVANKPAAKKQPAIGSLTGRQQALSNEQIGQAAGEVWRVLTENDGQSLAALKKSIDAPADLVVAALGWLAREDKLEFVTSGRSLKVSLR